MMYDYPRKIDLTGKSETSHNFPRLSLEAICNPWYFTTRTVLQVKHRIFMNNNKKNATHM